MASGFPAACHLLCSPYRLRRYIVITKIKKLCVKSILYYAQQYAIICYIIINYRILLYLHVRFTGNNKG